MKVWALVWWFIFIFQPPWSWSSKLKLFPPPYFFSLMLIWWTHMNIIICFFPINIYSIPIIRTKYTYIYIYIYSKLYVQNIFILFPNYTYKIYIFIPNNTYKINIFFPNYTYEIYLYMFQIIRTKYIYICFWHESTKLANTDQHFWHRSTFLTQMNVKQKLCNLVCQF